MEIPTAIANDAMSQGWLKQFNLGDRSLAKTLLETFLLVSRDDFIDHMRAMLLREAESVGGMIALYAERELGHRHGITHRLFKESTGSVKRAYGVQGPAAVQPTKAYDRSVGSEGIVAQMISQLCLEHPEQFLDHPGPDKIRSKRATAFWVVTDLVGSGDRATRYLDGAWRVRSVRSWSSGKLMQFAVMAYSATAIGERNVLRHPCKPKLCFVAPCPTIDSSFSERVAEEMKRLCATYDPTKVESQAPWTDRTSSLGHKAGGALIAFGHGAPNNTPLMFHKASKSKKNTWVPLFPSRVSAGISREAFGVDLTAEKISSRLSKLGDRRLAKSKAVLGSDISTGQTFLLLSALSHRQRLNNRFLAERTGLLRHQLLLLLVKVTDYGWIDSKRRLTDQGAGQLAHARKQIRTDSDANVPVGNHEPEPYYPSSLRQPI